MPSFPATAILGPSLYAAIATAIVRHWHELSEDDQRIITNDVASAIIGPIKGATFENAEQYIASAIQLARLASDEGPSMTDFA